MPFKFILNNDECLCNTFVLLSVCVIETYCDRPDKYDLNHAFNMTLTDTAKCRDLRRHMPW